MTGPHTEPTAIEAGEMLLKIRALLGACSICLKAIDSFWECVPQSNWLDVFGPAVFAVLALLFAGRIAIWNMLGVYISAIPTSLGKLGVRLFLSVVLALSVFTTANVFSPLFAGGAAGTCPTYTLFYPS